MRLHHIAYVCKSIEQKADELITLFGCTILADPVRDEYQGVRIQFVLWPDGTRTELLEPLGAESPVQRFLQRGGGLYHVCFEVDDIDVAIKSLTAAGRAFLVKDKAPAPAIENKQVAFLVTEQKELIEIVEKQKG